MSDKPIIKKSNKKIWIWSSVGCLGIMLIFIILVFSACAAFIDEVDKEFKKIETSSQVETNSKVEVAESKSGTRSKPVNFNTPAIVNEWIHGTKGDSFDAKLEVQILEVIRGEAAMEILAKENQYNDQ